MGNKTITTTTEKESIKAFNVQQALVGLELAEGDQTTLQYFDFFSQQVPIFAAYFLHVLPKIIDLDQLFVEELQRVTGELGIHEEVERRLSTLIHEHYTNQRKAYTEYSTAVGNPLEELLKFAEELKTDLTVIGQRSKGSFHGILAKNLARKTQSNTLIIPSEAKCQLSRIMVPIDFSPNSVKALQTAVAINKQLMDKVPIHCVNVYDTPDVNMYKISRSWKQYDQIIRSNIQDAFDIFLANIAKEERSYIKQVLVGRDMPGISDYLMAYAKENDVDFIVMGAKGHSKVHLLLMGSVAERVLQLNKSIPTLIVK